MKLTFCCALIILFNSFRTSAQTGLPVGSKIPNFSMLDAVSLTPKSLSEYNGSKGVVLVFHSITCPFAKMYDVKLGALIDEFKAKGISFIFIDTPTIASGESAEDIKLYVQGFGHNIQYWVDSDKKIGRQLGATKVPEVFVLKNVNASFLLFYAGAIDNSPSTKSANEEECYLQDALKALVTQSSIKVNTKKPSGCAIDDY